MTPSIHTRFPLHDLLLLRWSPLAFAGDSISPSTLGQLFEAARWAPSSYNEQPWAFVFATRENAEAHERLASCLVDANRAWAERAPVLLLVATRQAFERNGKPNAHAWYDAGQAMAHLTVQATSLDLVVHQMAGFVPDRARSLLDLPATHDPVAMAAIGRYGDPAQLSEEHRERERNPRVRKELGEFLFEGKWGVASSDLA